MSEEITKLHKLLLTKAREDEKAKLYKLSQNLLEGLRVNGIIHNIYTYRVENSDHSVVEFEATLQNLINQAIDNYLAATEKNREQRVLSEFLSKVENLTNQLAYLQSQVEGDQ